MALGTAKIEDLVVFVKQLKKNDDVFLSMSMHQLKCKGCGGEQSMKEARCFIFSI